MRPLPAHIRRAREKGVCPWCGYSTEGLEGDLCPECGNNLRAALGPPDPGTRQRARWGMFLALFFIAAVAFVQQFGESAFSKAGGSGGGAAPATVEVEPPSLEAEITAKMFTRFAKAFKQDPKLAEEGVGTVEAQARAVEEKFRAAMLAGELMSEGEAEKRFAELEVGLKEGSPLRGDLAAVRRIYEGERPTSTEEAGLRERHGYFGELVLTHNLKDTDAAREKLVGGGMALLLLIFGVGGLVVLAFIAGTVLLIVFMSGYVSGRIPARFVPPTPGGSLAIEMVALFAFGFLVLKALVAAVEMVSPASALWVGLLAQWGLLAVVLWPRFTGARGGLALVGWHRGEGVVKEVGCGIVGYLACVPLFITGAVLSVILTLIWAAIERWVFGAPPPPPHNPLFDVVSGKAGMWVVVMIFFLASLWAPIVEETVFRGAMFRQLRSKWAVFPAAAFSAVCFGVMHAYPLLMMGPVIALGFGFAYIREWRGSLIASMTAHCIHNAMVLGLLIFAMKLMG